MCRASPHGGLRGKHKDFVVNVRSHGGHVAAITIVLEVVFNAACRCQVLVHKVSSL